MHKLKGHKHKLPCVPGLFSCSLSPHHELHISSRREDLRADSVVVIQQGVDLSRWNGSLTSDGSSERPEVWLCLSSSPGHVEQLCGARQHSCCSCSSHVRLHPQGGSQQELNTGSTHLSPEEEEEEEGAAAPGACTALRRGRVCCQTQGSQKLLLDTEYTHISKKKKKKNEITEKNASINYLEKKILTSFYL